MRTSIFSSNCQQKNKYTYFPQCQTISLKLIGVSSFSVSFIAFITFLWTLTADSKGFLFLFSPSLFPSSTVSPGGQVFPLAVHPFTSLSFLPSHQGHNAQAPTPFLLQQQQGLPGGALCVAIFLPSHSMFCISSVLVPLHPTQVTVHSYPLHYKTSNIA